MSQPTDLVTTKEPHAKPRNMAGVHSAHHTCFHTNTYLFRTAPWRRASSGWRIPEQGLHHRRDRCPEEQCAEQAHPTSETNRQFRVWALSELGEATGILQHSPDECGGSGALLVGLVHSAPPKAVTISLGPLRAERHLRGYDTQRQRFSVWCTAVSEPLRRAEGCRAEVIANEIQLHIPGSSPNQQSRFSARREEPAWGRSGGRICLCHELP